MKKLLIIFMSSFAFLLVGCEDGSETSSDNGDLDINVTDSEQVEQSTASDDGVDSGNNTDNDHSNDSSQNEGDDSESTFSDDNKDASQPNEHLDEMEVHFIDVGQADAALLEYSEDDTDYDVMIDTGNWNADESVSYLNKEDVTDLDLLVGSHPHADHIGQMDKVIDAVEVDEVWMSGDDTDSNVYDRVIDAIDTNDIDYNEPRAGDEYDVGPLEIEVVSPASLNGDLNDDSIVMKAIYGDVSFMFTGDAENEAEQGMLRRNEDLDSDILKVGHHGSNTSSTQGFVDAVDPKTAVISIGEDNKYDHPDQEVVSRFQDAGIDLYATKDNGTVTVSTDGEDYDVSTEQEKDVTASSSDGGYTSSSSSDESESSKKSDTKNTPNSECIDINDADAEELQGIKHIGLKRAQALIDKRPYQSVKDLVKVDGIASSRIEDIQDEGNACVN